MQVIANIFTLLFLLVAVAVPIWTYSETRSYPHLILSAWGTIFAWSLVVCLALPMAFRAIGVDNSFNYFPEGPAMAACGVMGWVFGLELALLILIVRSVAWLSRRSFHKPNQKR